MTQPRIEELPSGLTALPNGLRVASFHLPDSRVEYFGVSIDAGSRDDPPGLHGLAHFVEHTIFKGTARHRSAYVINRMESVGGELNAFTTKEETAVYTIAPAGNLERSADLVADLVTASVFPEAEIEREREVVLDEIASYLDTPADAVVDDFEDLIFEGSGLGHNILGTPRSVRAITSDDCRRYLADTFTPERMVVFYSGPESHERLVRRVGRTPLASLARAEGPTRRITPKSGPQFNIIKELGNHQSHTIIGALAPAARNPRRTPFMLLANILGGPGMNSLLNVELRERRGLVYAVDASLTLLSDVGLFSVYFGCDESDTRRCSELVRRKVDMLASGWLTEARLVRSKRQYRGQMVVASSGAESRALGLGRSVCLYDKIPSLRRAVDSIEAITTDDVTAAAASLASSLSSLTLA